MSGIARVKEKMKKKIAFDELSSATESNERQGRKIYSLTKNDNMMLKKIFSKRLNLRTQTSISDLMSEAIGLLFCKEFPKDL
ncbi:MAG: hypothetical protein JJU12_01640 [Chlamydiales bacterium]|nr:hypothetical protein [Chlamydiales bacterium]